MKFHLSIIIVSILLVTTISKFAYAQENIQVTIKQRQQQDSEYCLYMLIKNHHLDKMSLNLFGGQRLIDSEGAVAEYDMWATIGMKPKLDPNLKLLRGEVSSGWSCWTLPMANFEPDKLILYQLITNIRYAILELKNSKRTNDRQVSLRGTKSINQINDDTKSINQINDDTKGGNFTDKEEQRNR